MDGKDPMVVVLDNRLDAHFGNLDGCTAIATRISPGIT